MIRWLLFFFGIIASSTTNCQNLTGQLLSFMVLANGSTKRGVELLPDVSDIISGTTNGKMQKMLLPHPRESKEEGGGVDLIRIVETAGATSLFSNTSIFKVQICRLSHK